MLVHQVGDATQPRMQQSARIAEVRVNGHFAQVPASSARQPFAAQPLGFDGCFAHHVHETILPVQLLR